MPNQQKPQPASRKKTGDKVAAIFVVILPHFFEKIVVILHHRGSLTACYSCRPYSRLKSRQTVLNFLMPISNWPCAE